MRTAPLTAERRKLLDRMLASKGASGGSARSAPARIGRVDADRSALPLSFAQQRIWFLNRMLPEETVYNVAGAARLRGRLDVELMRRCLREVVLRHEVLRTTYHPGPDGKGVQCVRDDVEVALPVTDLRGHPDADAAVRAQCEREVSRPFDLEQDLMLRPVLLRLADDEHLLVLCQHHVATDGWSLNLLIGEVAALYGAFAAGRPSPLEPLALQYGDYAAWQREWLTPERMRSQLDYWKQRLADTRLVDAATGLPRPTALTWDGGTLQYRMPAELVGRLRALAEAERATPYMALVAAYAVVLSRWSGQRDVVVGCPVAGRTRAEVAPLIGCFINELPLRLDLSGEPTYRDLLRQAREVCLGAYANQDVPFEKVVEEVNPERDAMSHAPLVRHQLGLHNEPKWRVELPELTFELATLSSGTARFDLEVDLTIEDAGGIHGMVYYSTDLYREDVVLRMLDRLTTTVAGAVADPDAVVWGLPLLGGAERAAVVDVPVAAVDGPPATVHELVEAGAAATPDAVAVLDGDGPLTYRELDGRANRLAWWLRHLGVGPDRQVPVVVAPSATRLVALLAVLKAGGAAVPVDPARSGAEVRAVLDDTAARLVLTDADTLLDPGLRLSEVDPAVRMLALDTVAERIESYPDTRPEPVAGPDDLAVVCYAPHGDGVRGLGCTHAAVVHRLRWMAGAFPLTAGESVRPRERTELDGGPWDLLWPLAAGARLVLGAHPPEAEVLRSTPSGLAALLADPATTPSDRLRQIVLDGEDAWPALVTATERALPGVRVALLRGPSAAAADLLAELPGSTRSIAPGARPVLLDGHGELVPLGVPGELHLDLPHPPRAVGKGPGPVLVADPTGGAGPLFGTGLRARVLVDAAGERRLELLGPVEEALTVNRHRVELTELTASLGAHPEVDRAAVVAHPDPEGGDPRLVAHVSLTPQDDDGQAGAKAFEQAYTGRAAEDDPALNLGGWTSPGTGELLAESELREWSDWTFQQVLALRPRQVLEIGCRTGSLLFRLAPRCDGYVGTDLSARALTRIRQHQDWLATKAQAVTLLERGPGELADLADGAFDTVVLNAVVQYFPDLAHLEEVLREAARLVADGGAIYLSDVRSHPLTRALHLTAPWGGADPDDPADELLRRIDARAGAERELAVDPRAFRDLAARVPGVTAVSVLPKVGRGRNELMSFRYDVVLHLGARPADQDQPRLDWREHGLTAAGLREILASVPPAPLLLTGVPDARLAVKLQALALLDERRVGTVGELTEGISPVFAAAGGPVDPFELVAAAQEHGYEVAVRHGEAGGPGDVDVVLRPAGTGPTGTALAALAPAPAPAGPDPAWTNDPVRAARVAAVAPQLRSHLQVYFPTYMLPGHVVVLDEWPVGPAGTLDRPALPLPVQLPADAAAAQREPATETERTIARIWADALGVDHIGVHDDFFSLGGHSLMGAEVVERVRDVYDVDLPLGRLFESPTVAAAAEYVDGVQSSGAASAASLGSIKRIDRSSYRTRRARDAEPAAATG